MENKQRQILSEINDMAASIRGQLELLENKILELDQLLGVEPETTPIEVDLDDIELPDIAPVYAPVESPVPSEQPAPEAPAETSVAASAIVEDAPALVLEGEEDLPESAVAPIIAEQTAAPTIADQAAEAPSRRAVIDAMAEHQAWRTDMPGSTVRDIRSAISLNDRLFFINTLFNRDAVLFQNTICALNKMNSLDEAVEYLSSHETDWNFESDGVYRFMMAVRRRLK